MYYQYACVHIFVHDICLEIKRVYKIMYMETRMVSKGVYTNFYTWPLVKSTKINVETDLLTILNH